MENERDVAPDALQRLGDAVLVRGLLPLVEAGPGPAPHHFVLRRIRDDKGRLPLSPAKAEDPVTATRPVRQTAGRRGWVLRSPLRSAEG